MTSLLAAAYVLSAIVFDPLTGEHAGRAFLVETREQCNDLAVLLDAKAAESGLALLVRCDDVTSYKAPSTTS